MLQRDTRETAAVKTGGGEEAVKTNAAWVWLSSKNQGGSVMFKWKLLQTPAHHDWSPVWWCSANSLIPHLLSSHFRLCAGVREGGDGREEWLAGRLGNTENKGSWKGRGILPAKAAWLPGMVRSGAALHLRRLCCPHQLETTGVVDWAAGMGGACCLSCCNFSSFLRNIGRRTCAIRSFFQTQQLS